MGSSHFVQVAPQYKTNYCTRTVAAIRVFFVCLLFLPFSFILIHSAVQVLPVIMHRFFAFCLTWLLWVATGALFRARMKLILFFPLSVEKWIELWFFAFRLDDNVINLRGENSIRSSRLTISYEQLHRSAIQNFMFYVYTFNKQQNQQKKGKHHRSEKCWMNIGIAEGWSKNRITTWQYLAVVENLFWTGIAHK